MHSTLFSRFVFWPGLSAPLQSCCCLLGDADADAAVRGQHLAVSEVWVRTDCNGRRVKQRAVALWRIDIRSVSPLLVLNRRLEVLQYFSCNTSQLALVFLHFLPLTCVGLACSAGSSGLDPEAAADLYMLDIHSLNWSIVASASGVLPARHGHGFAASFGKLFLFGGLSSSSGTDVYIITLI
jgi:hypothetical protein